MRSNMIMVSQGIQQKFICRPICGKYSTCKTAGYIYNCGSLKKWNTDNQ